MALQRNKIDLIINGEKLSYDVTSQEANLYARAESIINKKISDLNSHPESKNLSPTYFLKAVMVSMAVDLVRTSDVVGKMNNQIDDINSLIENYLTNKIG